MRTPKKCCGTCKLWNIKRITSSKTGRLLRGHVTDCMWRYDGPVPISMSVISSFPIPGCTGFSEGAACPCYESR